MELISTPARASRANTTFDAALMTLGAALVVNTVLGPLATGVIDYSIPESVRNQLIGLEIVSVALVTPLSVVASVLACAATARRVCSASGRPPTPPTCSCSTS